MKSLSAFAVSSIAAVGTSSQAAAPATTLEQTCEGRDGWSDPAPPYRIHGEVFYVGTCGITSVLIATPSGHVLIDGATDEAAASIVANIKDLGFQPTDVRYILSSHEHVDHVGGLAALKRITGAKVVARAPAREVLERGAVDSRDPQAGTIDGFPPVKVDRTIDDRGVLKIGTFRIVAQATPGHTRGGTSWTWRSCVETKCVNVVYADSLSAVSADDYRFTDHPELVAAFRKTFARVESLPCDLLITPHPGASNLFARLAGGAPLIGSGQCAAYAAGARKRLDDRLAKETRVPGAK